MNKTLMGIIIIHFELSSYQFILIGEVDLDYLYF